MKVAVVTCHNQPDYIRAVTLRQAVIAQRDISPRIIKNRSRGILRYLEMMLRVTWLRLRYNPDIYILTFRGYELLPFMTLITVGKKLIYDELINPIEWLQEARTERWAKLIPQKPLKQFNRLLLSRCQTVITDTAAHTDYVRKLMNLPAKLFVDLPVGTDETMFHKKASAKSAKKGAFRVFYYGSMLPLHGLDIVLQAAEQLTDFAITFTIIGGKRNMAERIADAQARGVHITYKSYVPFSEIPSEIAKADVCLAGPFGDTTQATHVLTGKAYQFLAAGAVTVIGQNKASSQFHNQKNALVVPLGNAKALADTLRWAYTHQGKLPAIAAAGHDTYSHYYSSTILAKKMAQILQR